MAIQSPKKLLSAINRRNLKTVVIIALLALTLSAPIPASAFINWGDIWDMVLTADDYMIGMVFDRPLLAIFRDRESIQEVEEMHQRLDEQLNRLLGENQNEIETIQSQIAAENRSATSEEQQRLSELQQNIEDFREKIEENNQALSTVRQDDWSGSTAAVDQIRRDGVSTCTNLTNFSIGACITEGVAWLASLTLWLLSLALDFAGILFNWSIQLSIVNFKDLADMTFVAESWRMVRDLANIAFIFILLYIAISTILQINSGQAKKMIGHIIIIALLVNFSAVLTRVVIDVSNVISVSFYNNIGTETDGNTAPDISAIFITGVGPSQFVGAKSGQAPVFGQTGGLSFDKVIISALGSSILIIVTTLVILAAAVLFIIRTIILLLLIILAPLAFVGYVIPKLKGDTFDKWVKELTNQAIFAPVFMVMLFITLKIADNRHDIMAASEGWGGALQDTIMFIFLVGFLLAAIIIASKLGAHGGSWAKGFAVDRSKKWGKKAGIGTVAGAGVYTAGKTANKIAGSDRLKSWAAKSPVIGGLVKKTAQKTAGLKFGGETSYEDRLKKRQERRMETTKGMNPEQKAEYLKNVGEKLLMIGGKEDRKKMYEGLPDREKADMEMAARQSGNTELVNVLTELRQGLKGEKKDSIEKEIGNRFKREYQDKGNREERGKFYVSLDPADRKILYGNLSNTDRAGLETEITAGARKVEPGYLEAAEEITKETADPTTNKDIGLKYSLSAEDQNKLVTEMKKVGVSDTVRQAMDGIGESIRNQNDGAPIDLNRLTTQLNELSSKQVAALDSQILENEAVIKLLNKEDVAAIQRAATQGEGISRGTWGKVEKEILAGNGMPEARAYLESTAGAARKAKKKNPPTDLGNS
ncbi:MAG: hypothetical protein WDZ85_03200 [Candidatus Paceibacterota bacterium]